jgi:hypothetical protein
VPRGVRGICLAQLVFCVDLEDPALEESRERTAVYGYVDSSIELRAGGTRRTPALREGPRFPHLLLMRPRNTGVGRVGTSTGYHCCRRSFEAQAVAAEGEGGLSRRVGSALEERWFKHSVARAGGGICPRPPLFVA